MFSKRDHGNLLFIDLRDHYGRTQCVVDTENKCFEQMTKLRPETVIKVTGKVVERAVVPAFSDAYGKPFYIMREVFVQYSK